MRIGILSLQGAFIEHKHILEKLNIESFEIRKKSDLDNNQIDGLILPGGESTTISKLLYDLDLYKSIKLLIEKGLPVFGTCAGLILLAKKIENSTSVHFGTMDIEVKRNAYGRQLGSFYTEGLFKGLGIIPMTFIRAPYITQVSDSVEILATVNGNIVAAQQDNMLVTSFHPELDNNLEIHRYFLKICEKNKI